MQPFELARLRPQTLLGLSVACGVVAALLFLWLVARAIERLVDQPRLPRPGVTHGVYLILAAFFGAIALAAFGTNRLLLDHARLRAPMRLGHLRCEPLADGRVRATFSPEVSEVLSEGHAVANDNAPAPQISEDAGTTCRIQADVITMRALPRRFAGPYLARAATVGQTERNRRASDLWRPEAKQFPISLFVREVARVQADAPADPGGRWAVIAMPPDAEAVTGETTAETMTASPTAAPVLGLQRLAP